MTASSTIKPLLVINTLWITPLGGVVMAPLFSEYFTDVTDFDMDLCHSSVLARSCFIHLQRSYFIFGESICIKLQKY